MGGPMILGTDFSAFVECCERREVRYLIVGGYAVECGLPRDSKAQAEQVRSIAVELVGTTIGRLSAPQLAALDEALRLHLAL